MGKEGLKIHLLKLYFGFWGKVVELQNSIWESGSRSPRLIKLSTIFATFILFRVLYNAVLHGRGHSGERGVYDPDKGILVQVL
jgi:hypothetical protein